MGWLSRFWKGSQVEERAADLGDIEGMMRGYTAPPYMGGVSSAGVMVDENAAMALTAMQAAVRLIAGTVASLPLVLYERTAEGRRRATDHPSWRTVAVEPNPWQTRFEFRETLTAAAAMHGNGLAEVIPSRQGNVAALVPLNYQRTSVERRGLALRYEYLPDNGGAPRVLSHDDVVHVRDLHSPDGIVGVCRVRWAAEAIGTGLAQDQFAGRYYSNGAAPSLMLQTDESLSDRAYQRLRDDAALTRQGIVNAHGVPIFEEGLKATSITPTAEQAMIVSARGFTVAEVARLYNVPLSLLGAADKLPYASVVEQNRAFLVYTLSQWLPRIEQAVERAVLLPSERGRYYCEFLVDGLLRLNPKERGEFYKSLMDIGAMSPNEVRRLENMPPISEAAADDFYMTRNLARLGSELLGEEPAAAAGDQPADPPQRSMSYRVRAAEQRLAPWGDALADVAERIVAREARQVRRAASQAGGLAELEAKAGQLYAGELAGFIERAAAPVARGMLRTLADDLPADRLGELAADWLGQVAADWCRSSTEQLAAAAADGPEAIEQLCATWEETRAAAWAEEVRQAAADRLPRVVALAAGSVEQ